MSHKYATTFGSSTVKENSFYYKEGFKIGRILAKNGYTVKCGGYKGVMEAVAKGVNSVNGTCIGVTNKEFDSIKLANKYISEEIKCNDIYERLRLLISNSEIFVVQYGGIGTLSEFFLVWTNLYMNSINNCKLCLIGDFWDKIIQPLNELSIHHTHFDMIQIYSKVEDFESTINNK
ncbi:MAG: LOG family protein [Ignavibacteriaceae bacterium]